MILYYYNMIIFTLLEVTFLKIVCIVVHQRYFFSNQLLTNRIIDSHNGVPVVSNRR